MSTADEGQSEARLEASANETTLTPEGGDDLPTCYWDDDESVYVLQTVSADEWVSADEDTCVALDEAN